VEPAHIGELLPAIGVVGGAFTTTPTIAVELVHPETVTLTLYIPVAAAVAPAIEGFCITDAKLFGPVQLYNAPARLLAVKFIVPLKQTGELLPAVGAAGIGLIVTLVVAIALVHPATVAVTE
jgi:hypothetical protein